MDELMEKADCCHECQYGIAVHDYYGTGDSPTMYECDTTNPADCLYVERYYENRNQDDE